MIKYFESELKFRMKFKIKDPNIALMIWYRENLDCYKRRVRLDNIKIEDVSLMENY